MTTALKDFCKLHRRDPYTVERQSTFTFLALKAEQPVVYRIDLDDLFCYSSLQPELHYLTDVTPTLPVTSSCAEAKKSIFQTAASKTPSTHDNFGLQVTEFASHLC